MRNPIPVPVSLRGVAAAALLPLLAAACDGPNEFRDQLRPEAVAVGERHGCALMETGEVFCWGSNERGQMGSGAAGGSASTPMEVEMEVRLRTLSAGGDRTCGLTQAGKLFCWGENDDGALGAGFEPVTRPAAVAPGMTFTQVSVADRHLCALEAGGKAWCWGRNQAGQLGTGTSDTETHRTPLAVAGGLTFTSISASIARTCAVAADGKGYCWGLSFGVFPGEDTRRTSPAQVMPGRTFTALESGSTHVCGIAGDGRTLCAGTNTSGQLGTGALEGGSEARVSFGGAATLRVAPTPENTIVGFTCIVADDRSARCAGGNPSGQLGTATSPATCLGSPGVPCSPAPVTVPGGLRFLALETGLEHACGLTDGRDVYCWGRGDAGQLGQGQLAGSATPVRVLLPEGRESGA